VLIFGILTVGRSILLIKDLRISDMRILIVFLSRFLVLNRGKSVDFSEIMKSFLLMTNNKISAAMK
jgi:hypothetical protein